MAPSRRAFKQNNAITYIRTAVHNRRRQHHIAKAYYRTNMMQRRLHFLFTINVDTNGIVLQMQVGIGRHNIERIEDLLHQTVPAMSTSLQNCHSIL